MTASTASPTRFRFWVLAVLCSLGFLTYLDRICIMRVQGEIKRDLEFHRPSAAEQAQLAASGTTLSPPGSALSARRMSRASSSPL